MKKASLFTVPALCFLAGCNLDSSHEQSTAPGAPDDAKAAEWEPLPEGRSYLLTGTDSAGTPIYTPVRLLDTLALIEGDIIIAAGREQMEKLRADLVDPKEARPAALAKASGFVKSSTYTGGANSWPGGYIPYLIGGGVDRFAIESAVYEFNQTGSGITYVPRRASDAQGVVFVPASEQVSSSSTGMNALGQWQPINLIQGASNSSIMHEMGHAAGLYHEHTRPDRGTYITITTTGTDQLDMWNRAYKTKTDGTNVGDYDLKSIMHYGNGTASIKNPDGTYYKITLTARNGQSTGNSRLSEGDKVSLWGVSVNQNPFYGVSAIGNVSGKISKAYVTYANGTYRRFVIIYDRNTGNANVTALNDNNSVSNSVQNLVVGAGFTTVLPYNTESAAPCMLFYKASTGELKIYNVFVTAGALNPTPAYSGGPGSWNTGWTTIEPYESGSTRFLFFQNASTSDVSIWRLRDNGFLETETYTGNWSGWVYSKPFYIEGGIGKLTPYFVFRSNTGLTRIQEMTSIGTPGGIVADLQLPNYTTVGLWQSVSKAYLALTNGNGLFIVDMDNTGFRKTGLPYFRVSSLANPIAQIDAATALRSINTSGNFVTNKYYDFKQVMTYRFTTFPNSLYTGLMAPFH
jgi:hypothetical protein